jgi:hypothetical protein
MPPTSICGVEAFTTESERERMPEEFRTVRGDRSVPNPSLDRSDERMSMDPNRYEVSEPELLRGQNLS